MTPLALDQCTEADARFCGAVQLEKLIFNCLAQKVRDLADPERATTLTVADIQTLFDTLWNLNIRKLFNGSQTQLGSWTTKVPVETIRIVSNGTRITRLASSQLGDRTTVGFDR